MKPLILIVFGLTALAQWAVPLASIWKHEQVIKQGTLVRLRCRAPDPYDPLRGRYLAVAMEQTTIPDPLDPLLKAGLPIYLTLEEQPDGSAKVTRASASPPASGLYIKAEADGTYGGLTIKWPFDRYYLNEDIAPEADRWLAKMRTSDKPVLAEVRVLNGRAVLVDLTQDGKSFRDVLRVSSTQK